MAFALNPAGTLFVVVSFEGTDLYSQAGGLGVRIAGLVETLARADYETHLFFIGDPALPWREVREDGRLILNRWAQWISANCPGGVYDGEAAKVADVTSSLPEHLVNNVLAPAIAAGRVPIVLFEEWQTASCAIAVAAALEARGLGGRARLVWNANNTYGFDRIDWPRLAGATTITTISRHMRAIVRSYGADARVIPNGIPETSFDAVAKPDVDRVRAAAQQRANVGFLFKMARWEREKGWSQALDALAHARTRAVDDAASTPVLIARAGGPAATSATSGLAHEAAQRALRVVSFDDAPTFMNGVGDSVRAGADVVELKFGVTPSLARTLYAASSGVLANSVMEPFGLVGLEAMAAGGVAYTGGTGEDYAIPGRNAVVLETLDPAEIVAHWDVLASSPQLSARLRRAARRTARDYRWLTIAGQLLDFLVQMGLPSAATA